MSDLCTHAPAMRLAILALAGRLCDLERWANVEMGEEADMDCPVCGLEIRRGEAGEADAV